MLKAAKRVFSRLLKKSIFGSAGSISGDVLTWIDPSFSVLEPLRESFLAVHFASRVFQHPASIPDLHCSSIADGLMSIFLRCPGRIAHVAHKINLKGDSLRKKRSKLTDAEHQS
ncbi:MAG TPA: hypothetical protein VLH56_15550 [Dissulfurispiraceae bacterium]|nr:hypothetical protein [Dissulfurispiraceae bacterium]